MKKSIIATGAASLALAAMPVVGVFAEPDAGSPSVVDNVTVVINESCTFQAKSGTDTVVNPTDGSITRNFSKNATLGSTVYLGDEAQGGSGAQGTAVTIEGVCNSDGGSTKTGTWTISALGSNSAKMIKTGGTGAGDPDNIPTGTATSGTDSAWAMKIVSSTTGGFGSWKEVPSASATPVHSGTADGESFSFKPQYQVYVGTEQASGTYTGTVTYTIASTWDNN